MEVSGQLKSRGMSPHCPLNGTWCHGTDVDAMENRKISWPSLELNHNCSVVKPVARRCYWLSHPVDSWRVLTMVYNTQNCWLLGLCPSTGILKKIREHDVLETGSVSVLTWRGDTYSVGSLRKSEPQSLDQGPNRVFPPSPENGNIQFPKRRVL
jgi:hypothetical protein